MAKKIYVGNLSFNMSDEQLSQLFQPFGQVSSAQVVKDKFTGRSRGFGFVEMNNNEEADKAIAALNGKDVDGRALKVSEAQPREDRPRGGGYGGGEGRRGGRDRF
jgi:cold-inducible RNA-binding protein